MDELWEAHRQVNYSFRPSEAPPSITLVMRLPSFFDEMDDSYRKLDVAILALACELFNLASVFPKNPIVPQPVKERLLDACCHLKHMSRELLEFRQEVKTKKNLDKASCASIRSSFLDVFQVLKPLYPLYWAMDNQIRYGEILQFQKLYLVIVDDTKIRELDIFDSAVSKIVDKTCQDLKVWFREGFNMYTGLTLRLDQHLQKANVFSDPTLSSRKKESILEYNIRVERRAAMNEECTSTYEHMSFFMDGIVVAVPTSEGFIVNGKAAPRCPNLCGLWCENKTQSFMGFLYAGAESLVLNILAQIILILSCIRIRRFPSLERMEGGWSMKDAEAAGPLIFHDTQISSMCSGRRKQREIYLFQHLLMFARKKEDIIIVAQKISLEKLLLVVHWKDALSVYWEESSSSEKRVQCIDIFFTDQTSMYLWAGFLSMWTPAALKLPASVDLFSTSIQTEALDSDGTYLNKHLQYLAQLGPTSIRQATDILLPLIKSIIQSPPYNEGILHILTCLGQKLSAGQLGLMLQ